MSIVDNQNIFNADKLEGDKQRAHSKSFPMNQAQSRSESGINSFDSVNQYQKYATEDTELKQMILNVNNGSSHLLPINPANLRRPNESEFKEKTFSATKNA